MTKSNTLSMFKIGKKRPYFSEGETDSNTTELMKKIRTTLDELKDPEILQSSPVIVDVNENITRKQQVKIEAKKAKLVKSRSFVFSDRKLQAEKFEWDKEQLDVLKSGLEAFKFLPRTTNNKVVLATSYLYAVFNQSPSDVQGDEKDLQGREVQ